MTNTANPLYTGEPMEVRRVDHAGGSRIEPPLDQSWTDFDKLRWCAGVVLADAGIYIRVTRWNHPQKYSLSGETPTRSWSHSDGNFYETWRAITNLGMGAQIARDHEANKEES